MRASCRAIFRFRRRWRLFTGLSLACPVAGITGSFVLFLGPGSCSPRLASHSRSLGLHRRLSWLSRELWLGPALAL